MTGKRKKDQPVAEELSGEELDAISGGPKRIYVPTDQINTMNTDNVSVNNLNPLPGMPGQLPDINKKP